MKLTTSRTRRNNNAETWKMPSFTWKRVKIKRNLRHPPSYIYHHIYHQNPLHTSDSFQFNPRTAGKKTDGSSINGKENQVVPARSRTSSLVHSISVAIQKRPGMDKGAVQNWMMMMMMMNDLQSSKPIFIVFPHPLNQQNLARPVFLFHSVRNAM